MSTHNIGFYEDLTKIIFQLSSNIINYKPYLFSCSNQNNLQYVIYLFFYHTGKVDYFEEK